MLSRTTRALFLVWLLCVSLIAAGPARAASPEFEPQVGQAGKDVIWVPTSQELVDKMLDLAKVTASDYVIDLGSGDGRMVITAAKRGARALGIEYEPDMVALSQKNAVKEGVSDRAKFIKADIFESDFSQATVITMFLLPQINMKLRPKILGLKPGTRIVSNSFNMGDWDPDETVEATKKDDCGMYCTGLLWIVPAKVEGVWTLPQGELRLKQDFQMLSGALKSTGKNTTLRGRVKGDEVTLTVGNAVYRGRVIGTTIEGTVESGGKSAPWSAVKAGKTS